MAVDTRDKRASVIGVALAIGLVLPNPDAAAEDQGDRQQLAYVYRGIAAGATVAHTAIWETTVSASPTRSVRASGVRTVQRTP